MAKLLKNIYNDMFFEGFVNNLTYVIDDFDVDLFLSRIFDNQWKWRELKQRMRHISTVLEKFLPQDYPQSVTKIIDIVSLSKENQQGLSLEYMFLPDFIAQYGLNDFNASVRAFEQITLFTSCEFAVRPFIEKYPEKMMRQMLIWSEHSHQNVRRLSSEGCRPRLPWAKALFVLKENPYPIIPILENLKDDTAEYVKKSVANNLNDISKDNPKVVIAWAKKWKGKSKNTDWIIKHGSRNLLKKVI